MNIEETYCPGWTDYPLYRCNSLEDYTELTKWMESSDVKYHLMGVSPGYIFQIRSNFLLFSLRWL